MKKTTVYFACSLFLMGATLFGCSKSEEAPSGASILDSEIVSYIPANSVGFFTWNTESASYKKLRASAWGQNMSKTVDMLSKLEESEETKKVVPIINALVENGFIPKNASQPDVIHSGVGFVEIDQTAKLPAVAIYMAASSGQDLTGKVPALEKAIGAQGAKIAKETVAGAEAFSIASGEASGAPFEKIYVAYTKDKLAIATSTQMAAKLFAGKPEGGIQQIKESNEFKKAIQGVSSPQESMSFAFFDMNKFVRNVASLGLSPEQDPTTELKDVPVDAVAASGSMKDSLSYSLAVALNPKNESQKKVIASLNGTGSNEILGKVPADLMLLITLDGKTIGSIKNAAMAEVPEEALGPMGEQLKLIDSLKSITIGIRGATGPTPFPEALIVAETSQAAELNTLVKSQLDLALASSGMPMPWQQKEIAGSQVSYALTPFGVGAYLTTSKDMVVVASAEKLVTDVLSPEKSASGNLLAGVSDSTKKMLSNNKPVVVAYSDFNKVANALSTAQDSLAMFTGGQGGISADQLKSLREVGTVMLALDMQNNLVRLNSTYELPPKG